MEHDRDSGGRLFDRVIGIVSAPAEEWLLIAEEPAEVHRLYLNYVAVLALIPALAGFIGTSVVGVKVPAVGTIRVPIITGLFDLLLRYVLAFVAVYVLALIVNALAPRFGGERDANRALKLTVYSYTPAWLAGIFLVLPGLSFLTILGLYGCYLLWLGLPLLMNVPPEKSLPCAAAVVVSALIMMVVLGLLEAALTIYPG